MTKNSAVNATKNTRRNYLPLGGVFTRIVLFSTLALFTAFTFTSCENFLNGADFKKQLEEDIAYAKAESVSFTVLPVNITQGQVTSDVTSAKVGYPVEISFEANTAYGNFLEWQAYSNYSYDEASQTILGDRLGEDEISFEESSKSTTKMTVHSPVKNIRIVPAVVPNPYIWFDSPSYTEGDIVYSVGKITPSGRSAINTQNTLSLTAESYSGYAIKNWRIQTPDGQVLKDLQAFYNDGENNIDVTKSFFGFSDDFTPSQNPLFTFNSASISDDQSSSSVLVTANTAAVEGYIFTPVCVARPKVLSVNPDVSQKISRTQTIVFTFNRELNESSVDVRVRSFSPSDSDFKIDDTIYNKPTVSGKTITLTTKKTVDAGMQIEITLLPLIADSEGITLGESKIYTFTTSDVLDNEPPVFSETYIRYVSAEDLRTSTIFGSLSTRDNPIKASHTKKVQIRSLIISALATDENTGNSGVNECIITERVVELTENMLISVNDGILDYTKETDDKNLYLVPIGGKSLYDSNGNWNGKWLSDVEQSRFFRESNIKSKRLNLDYEPIAIGGIHQISVQAVDGAGNISEPQEFFIEFIGEDEWNLIPATGAISKNDILGCSFVGFYAYKSVVDSIGDKIGFILQMGNSNENLKISSFSKKPSIYTAYGDPSNYFYFQPYSLPKNQTGSLSVFIADAYGCPIKLKTLDEFYIPKANIGDGILLNKNNGKITVLPYDKLVSYDGASIPIGVVVYSSSEHCYGWALEQKSLQWCTNNAAAISKSVGLIRKSEPELSEMWNVVCENDPNAKEHPEYYPAFNYCNNYGKDILGLNAESPNSNIKKLASAWYFATFDILYNSSNAREILNRTFNLFGAGGITSGNNSGYSYWTSSEYNDDDDEENVLKAWYFSGKEPNSGWGQTYKISTKYVRPVFDFFDMLSE